MRERKEGGAVVVGAAKSRGEPITKNMLQGGD